MKAIVRKPSWYRRHREEGSRLKLRIVEVKEQRGDYALVLAIPPRERYGAWLHLQWKDSAWSILGTRKPERYR